MDPAYLKISLNQSMALHKICTLQELDDPDSKGVTPKMGDEILEMVIVNWHGHLNAFQNSCPHTGINLNWPSDQFLSLDECISSVRHTEPNFVLQMVIVYGVPVLGSL